MAGDCTRAHPWTVLLGGPVAGQDEMQSLTFDVANPCGTEISSADESSHPLQVIQQTSTCVDVCADEYERKTDCGMLCPRPPSNDGHHAIVTGHVQGRLVEHGSGPWVPAVIGACQGFNRVPRLKLAIESCGIPGAVLIDADTSIIVPAGKISVKVLAPESFFAAGSGPVLGEEGSITDVTLRVTVCPLQDAYVPNGQLTGWLTFVQAATVTQRTIVVPRRARRFQINATTQPGGVSSNVQVDLFDGDPAGGGFLIGSQVFQSGFPLEWSIIGSASHILVQGVAAGISYTTYFRWEII